MTCSIETCEKPAAKRGWCGMHYERWRQHGDPTITLLPRDKPNYLSAHKRVHRRKGKAKDFACANNCGRPASQWAYDHEDPNELTGPMKVRGQVVELAFSTDPEHYVPLCGTCHHRLDHEHGNRHAAA
ncbi:MAG: hypothetical protein R2761_23630 [Acidimicrobiales bacterium]